MNNYEKEFINVSIKQAFWIARRINECTCAENLVKSSGNIKNIIMYSLSLRYDHDCPYKKQTCRHGYDDIICYDCFDTLFE